MESIGLFLLVAFLIIIAVVIIASKEDDSDEEESEDEDRIKWKKKSFNSTDDIVKWLNGKHTKAEGLNSEWTGWWGAIEYTIVPEKDGTYTVIYC